MNRNTRQTRIRDNAPKKRVKNNNKGVIVKAKASHPPPYTSQSVRSIRIRCLATAAVSSSFNNDALAGYLGVIATAATTSAFLTTVFKLKRIAIWGPVSTAGTPVTVNLSWDNTAGDFQSPPCKFSDQSISFDWPAFVDQRPPPGSLSSKWHSSANTDLCLVLTCPQGSTVEFEFDFVLNDDSGPLAGPALVGATLGQIYHKTVNNLTPTGVNAI